MNKKIKILKMWFIKMLILLVFFIINADLNIYAQSTLKTYENTTLVDFITLDEENESEEYLTFEIFETNKINILNPVFVYSELKTPLKKISFIWQPPEFIS